MVPPDPLRPNIVIVVMDCVRASDFPGGAEAVDGMRWTESLLKESTVFPRAISVAPWTIPAHASLFTGMLPWDHGCHARGNLSLRQDLPSLASLLGSAGYSTMSLSANPFINSTFGLVRGFDRAAWGGWWESYARLPRETPPDGTEVVGGGAGGALRRIRRGRLGSAMLGRMDDAYRYPALLDGMNRILQHLRAPDQVDEVPVSPWIEPTFERWVREVPSDRPLFAFVNLVDAHEPYYADSKVIRGSGGWVQYARARQDHVGFAAGSWAMRPEGARTLHDLYRASIRRIDRRLEALARLLERTGRWDSMEFILTSDHGQAFGEHGVLFHMFRADEAELRIPLIYRTTRRPTAAVGRGWSSLVDIAPTLLARAGVEPPSSMTGVELDSLVDRDRATPALAMSDGLVFGHVRTRFPPSRAREFDRLWGVAYDGERKALVDSTDGRRELYEVSRDPMERHNMASLVPDDDPLWVAARGVARKMASSAPTAQSPELEERLRSWGY